MYNYNCIWILDILHKERLESSCQQIYQYLKTNVFNQLILPSWIPNYEHRLTLLLHCLSLCCHSFLWKQICSSFLSFVFFIFQLEIKLLRGNVWDPINRFNLAICLCMSQCQTWISNVICRVLCYVQWVEVRGDCSFCWYWWTCWLLLFKLSFHLWSANTYSLNIAAHIVFNVL
jgi:hypothetical protein